MKAVARAVFGVGLLGLVASPAIAQGSKDWVEVKGEKDLRALYANKTHRGKDWVGHFRDDGKAILVFSGAQTPIPHTWAVKGDDQVCTTSNVGTSCYRYQRNGRKPRDVMATFVAQPVTFFFTVEDGIPKF